jgi:hypothetical protein
VQDILETPMTVPELSSFLGLEKYYHRFIKGYKKMVAPLYDLLKRNWGRDWSDECQSAFDKLKRAITFL